MLTKGWWTMFTASARHKITLMARIVEGYSGQTKAEPVPTVPATSAPGVRAQSAGAKVLLVEGQ